MSGIQLKNLRPAVDFGVSAFPMTGETACGDLHLVKMVGTSAMVAAVDGGGHGEEAARAARIAITTIENHALADVSALVELCHAALRRTRGAVMSLALFDGCRNTMTWLGIGNVEGVLFRTHPGEHRRRETLFLRGGMIGCNLPALRPASLPVGRGDLLILTTDGIRTPFDGRFALSGSPQGMAERICSLYGKPTDDGLALVVQYLGCAP